MKVDLPVLKAETGYPGLAGRKESKVIRVNQVFQEILALRESMVSRDCEDLRDRRVKMEVQDRRVHSVFAGCPGQKDRRERPVLKGFRGE